MPIFSSATCVCRCLAARTVDRLDRVDERAPPPGIMPSCDGRAGRRERIFDAVLLLFELGLGGRADLDDRDAAGQLGKTLLQLLAIEVGVGLLDLALDHARCGP